MLWIRIRIRIIELPGSGSVFRICILDPDADPNLMYLYQVAELEPPGTATFRVEVELEPPKKVWAPHH